MCTQALSKPCLNTSTISLKAGDEIIFNLADGIGDMERLSERD